MTSPTELISILRDIAAGRKNQMGDYWHKSFVAEAADRLQSMTAVDYGFIECCLSDYRGRLRDGSIKFGASNKQYLDRQLKLLAKHREAALTASDAALPAPVEPVAEILAEMRARGRSTSGELLCEYAERIEAALAAAKVAQPESVPTDTCPTCTAPVLDFSSNPSKPILRYCPADAAQIVIDDATVERAAKMVERMTTAMSYGWSDEMFEIWWNKDPTFVTKHNVWGSFSGTRKEKLLWETRLALEAAFQSDITKSSSTVVCSECKSSTGIYNDGERCPVCAATRKQS